jgi:hypothetical protein
MFGQIRRRLPQSVEQDIPTRALQAIDEDPLDPDEAETLKLISRGVHPGARPADVPGHGLLAQLDFPTHASQRRHRCVQESGAYAELRIMDDR